MSQKISIDRTELLRLRLVEAIAPHVHQRRMHVGTSVELVSRAIESGSFRLGEDGALIGDSVADFLSDVESSASYLFQSWDDQQQSPDEKRAQEDARVAAMTPAQKLAYANEQSFLKRKRGGKA
jgi:hypothetical protein